MSKWNGERRKEQTCPVRVGWNALMTARPHLSTLPSYVLRTQNMLIT